MVVIRTVRMVDSPNSITSANFPNQHTKRPTIHFIGAKNRTDWCHSLQFNLHRFSSFVRTKKKINRQFTYFIQLVGRLELSLISFRYIRILFLIALRCSRVCCDFVFLNKNKQNGFLTDHHDHCRLKNWTPLKRFLSVSIRNRVGNGVVASIGIERE